MEKPGCRHRLTRLAVKSSSASTRAYIPLVKQPALRSTDKKQRSCKVISCWKRVNFPAYLSFSGLMVWCGMGSGSCRDYLSESIILKIGDSLRYDRSTASNPSYRLVDLILFYNYRLETLNYRIYTKIFFFDTLEDLASIKPYVILTIPETTSMTDQFEVLAKSVNDHLEIGSNFDRVNSDLDAGIVWCNAIYNAMQEGFFPNVVLPLAIYEAAMSALHFGDPTNE